MTHDTIARLTDADRDAAAALLARAFRDDPLWCYLLPDRLQRVQTLWRFQRVFVGGYIGAGQAYGFGMPLQGVAIWSRPAESGLQLRDFLTAALPGLLLSPFPGTVPKAFPVFERFEVMRQRYARPPYSYLNSIGVAPEAQGRGTASRLIRPFLAETDAHGWEAYTETVTPANVGLYEHYGFVVRECYELPDADLRIWAFVRPAKRPSAH
jgi:ribosomal protein S18 acetylase RimI-like enzyme